jgi:hypothetical protein
MHIENIQLVESVFGKFPDFHDAKLCAFNLLVSNADDRIHLSCTILAFDTTGEKDDRGYFVQKNHTYVTFRFTDVEIMNIHFCTFPDVIFKLTIDLIPDSISSMRPVRVQMDSAISGQVMLQCVKASIESVEPLRREGE